MRAILTTAALASFIFACGSSTTSPGGGAGTDGGQTGTGSSSSGGGVSSSSSSGGNGSSGGTFSGSCPALGHTYSFHDTYVSGGADCMTGTPSDQTQTIDPSSGPMPPPADAGETCTDNLSGCTYTQSCSSADDAGDSETVSIDYSVASDGTISGTEQVAIKFVVVGQTINDMCVYSVVGTKIN